MGEITVSCKNLDATHSVVTMHKLLQEDVGTLEQHYYLGCVVNTKCSPANFWTDTTVTKIVGKKLVTSTISIPKVCAADGKDINCGGGVPTSLDLKTDVGMSAKLSCPCTSVYWVLHQAAAVDGTVMSAFMADQVDGACPSNAVN